MHAMILHSHRWRWRYILPALLMIGLTIASIIITLSTLRKEAISTHRNIAKLHSYAFEDIFTQTIQSIDHTMDRIPHLSDDKTTPPILGDIFKDVLQNSPYLRSFSLVNQEGVIEFSSHQGNQGKHIILDHFLPIPSFNNIPFLRIGAPWIGRDFDTAQPSSDQSITPLESTYFIPIIKKVFFDKQPYYLLAALNPDYFTNRYTQVLPSPNGLVSLWRLDGILLLSTDLTLPIGFSHFATIHEQEDMVRHLERSSHNAISAYRLAKLMPYIVEVKMDQNIALGYWDQERNKMLLVSILFISLSGILGLLLILRTDKEAQRQKQQNSYEHQFRVAMEATQTGLWTWNRQNGVITWDEQCYHLLGYKPYSFAASLEMIQSLTHPEDAQPMFSSRLMQIDLQGWFLVERRMKHANGAWVWVQVRGRVIEYDKDNIPLFLTGVYINIDTQKQAEQLRLNSVAFETEDAVLITDATEKIIKVNQAFTRITGYTSEEVIGKTPRILKSGEHNSAFYKMLWESLLERGYWQGELWNKRKNGEVYPEHITITAVKNAEGIVTHFLANFNDITLRKAAQRQIHEMAYRDSLTRLANRHLLQENILKAIERNQQQQIYGALIFIDLDQFKQLNDTHGHDAGDMLLIQVSRRLQDCTRQHDTVARLGGDEFVILLEDLGSNIMQATEQTHSVAHKILTYLNKPFDLAQGNYHVGASLGITLFGKTMQDAETLIKQADIAMYTSKDKGRNQISFFTPES
ncbi:MAG: diguanylate cyclase [Sulfurospirillaceae bacterium]|nr:diguanylate cyclase [Sulfurospirillaceae bacterium]MDD2826582.1 diguanylate cyclase [Sulfurospirillaceae bacterium]